MEHPFTPNQDNIRFSKAYDENAVIIDISDIKSQKISKQQEFTCVGCGEKLRPRTGEIRAAHFWHYKSDACAFETYLHKLGKEIFRKEFERRKLERMPFTLRLPEKQICNKYARFGKTCTSYKRDSKQVNLILEYPEIQIETQKGEFIPDLLIYNPRQNTFVFIEIVFSNAPSQEKYESGHPIIQINATCEEDFNFIYQGVISESMSNVQIHNFPEAHIEIGECYTVCQIDNKNKRYFESLDWLKRSFEHRKSHGLPFQLEYFRTYSCSRHQTKFETQCQYERPCKVDLTRHYESAEIIPTNESACLKLVHKEDSSRNIVFCRNSRTGLSEKVGGIIQINIEEIQFIDKNTFLSEITSMMTQFNIIKMKKNVIEKDCGGNCQQLHQFFCVKKDLGAVMLEMPLSDIRLQDSSFPYIRMLDALDPFESKEEVFFKMVESSLEERIPIKNCYVCRYHALNTSEMFHGNPDPIFCKTFKKSCRSNEAVNCERYRPDLESAAANRQGRHYKSHFRNRGWF
jgi:hypothetical protein